MSNCEIGDVHAAFRQSLWTSLAKLQADQQVPQVPQGAGDPVARATAASSHAGASGSFRAQIRRAVNASVGVAAGSSDPAAVRQAAIATFPLEADGRLPARAARRPTIALVGSDGIILDVPQRILQSEVKQRLDDLRVGVASVAALGNGTAATIKARIDPLLDTIIVAVGRPGGPDTGAVDAALDAIGSESSGALADLAAELIAEDAAVSEQVRANTEYLSRTATSIHHALDAYTVALPASYSSRIQGIGRAVDTVESQASWFSRLLDDRGVAARTLTGTLAARCDVEADAQVLDLLPAGGVGTWTRTVSAWATGVQQSLATLGSDSLPFLRNEADRLFVEAAAIGLVAWDSATYSRYVDPYLASVLNENASRVRLGDLIYQFATLAGLADLPASA